VITTAHIRARKADAAQAAIERFARRLAGPPADAAWLFTPDGVCLPPGHDQRVQGRAAIAAALAAVDLCGRPWHCSGLRVRVLGDHAYADGRLWREGQRHRDLRFTAVMVLDVESRWPIEYLHLSTVRRFIAAPRTSIA